MRERWSHGLGTLVPLLVIVAGLLLAWRISSTIRDRAAARFRRASQEVELRLRGRMDACVAMLHGAQGLFAASDDVTREEFHRYVEQLEVGRLFPGMEGIGYAREVAIGEAASLEAELRGQGEPGLQFWPALSAGAAILYLEPPVAANRRALGFDMASEPTRRAALERARDTGEPAMTAPLTLVQEGGGSSQDGFLIYLPIYAGPARPDTVEERRRALAGWVYAAFRAGDLLRQVLAGTVEPGVDLTLVDGPTGEVLARGPGPPPAGDLIFRAETEEEIAGRRWILRTSGDRELFGAFDELAPLLVLVVAIPLAVLLALVLRTLQRARSAAEEHAARATQLATATAEAVRMRDDFLSIASHELRTPLTPLRLQLQLLRRDGPVEEVQRRRLDVAERQVVKLTELTGDLLDVTRIQAGRLRLAPVDADLAPLVHEVVARHAAEAAAAGSDLDVRVEPARALVDPARLDQVVTNLLTNAIKYGDGRPIVVELSRRDGSVVLEVRDQGIGMAAVDVLRVFRRFERAASGRSYGGLGLGLYITHELVTAMGGTVTAASELGRGSTFRVEFPAG